MNIITDAAGSSIELHSDGDAVIAKSLAYSQLSVNEMRLLMLGLSRLRKNPSAGSHVRISSLELVRLFGGNKGYYNELDKLCHRLCSKDIVVNGRRINIFSFLRFSSSDGGLHMHFSSEVLPILVSDHGPDGEKDAFRLSSMYAIRILELLKAIKKHPALRGATSLRLKISVEELRSILGVPDTSTYRQMTNIRNKVLNNPIMDINNSVPYRVAYDVVKRGIKVTDFVFTMDDVGERAAL